MRSRWLSGIEHADVGMSGFPALKKYKSKLSIDKLASIRDYVYMFDLLKGVPLNITLGFLSMIAPWSPIMLQRLRQFLFLLFSNTQTCHVPLSIHRSRSYSRIAL